MKFAKLIPKRRRFVEEYLFNLNATKIVCDYQTVGVAHWENRDKGLITIAKGKYQDWLEPDRLILLQGWARDGLSEEQIAHNIGITRETLRVWKKQYSGISGALKKGKEVVDIAVENALLKKALSGDTTAMIFWLKNRKADRWRDRHENAIDLMGGNMGDFEIEVGAPDEQAED